MYDFFKILHIVAFTSWMAGLFYLPRLFVYHCHAIYGSKMDKTFQIMEYKLYFYIMIPAMVITLASGMGMLGIKYIEHDLPPIALWSVIKLICVSILIYYNIILNKYRLHFIHNKNTKTHIFYRYLNEVPTIVFIILTTSVVVKYTL